MEVLGCNNCSKLYPNFSWVLERDLRNLVQFGSMFWILQGGHRAFLIRINLFVNVKTLFKKIYNR